MVDPTSKNFDIKDPKSLNLLPAVPGESPLRHLGLRWVESAENKLAGPLMNVALGLIPEVCLAIQDHDLSWRRQRTHSAPPDLARLVFGGF